MDRPTSPPCLRRTAELLRAVALLFAMIEWPASIWAEMLPQSGVANACSLLTDRQVSEVMKMKVDPGIREDSGRLQGDSYQGAYSSTCIWKAASDRDAHDLSRPLG